MPIKEIELFGVSLIYWEQIFKEHPAVPMTLFLILGMFVREAVELGNVLLAWVRLLLLGDRRKKHEDGIK